MAASGAALAAGSAAVPPAVELEKLEAAIAKANAAREEDQRKANQVRCVGRHGQARVDYMPLCLFEN